MLSSVEDLKAIPCGSHLGSCTGQVVRLLPSDKKLTVLLICTGGELFPVTIFKNLTNQNALVKACILGNVLKIAPVKAQRFSDKFDGKIFFNTPLDYEFVVKANSKFEVLPAEVQSAQNFEELSSGGVYQISCIIASSFVQIDNMFACVVGDLQNKRADLYVHGVSILEKIGALKQNDQVKLARCYSRIDDECLTIYASVDNLAPMNRSFVLEKVLETPVKRKCQDHGDEPAYGQIFIVDTAQAMNALKQANAGVDFQLLRTVLENKSIEDKGIMYQEPMKWQLFMYLEQTVKYQMLKLWFENAERS
uniref:Uncharacterized protein n=1 Tax=Globodera rostochiensis TaxID=31243 RepID=A0A914GWP1_GLORO